MVTVLGLGFVGLTTALGFAEYGHKVYGFDVNNERADVIKSGKLPFFEPGLDKALERNLNKSFFVVDDLREAVEESEYIYYCVGTPYGPEGQADLTYLYAAVDETLKYIKHDKFRVLVVKSTVPPSTTKERIMPYVTEKGFTVGIDLGVANNPEFLREGYCWDDFINADRIVLGVSDDQSDKMLRKLYEPFHIPVYSVSLNTGEFIKYLSNTLLATLISYSNEMSIAADVVGDIQIAEAFRILHLDKRWGGCGMTSYVYPGCGYGGYCLPKDTNAFYSLVKAKGFDAKILENVIGVNDGMPDFIAGKIMRAVDESMYIGILGLSFKPGSDDVRDAPAAKVIKKLIEHGYKNIIAYDPIASEEFSKLYSLDIQYLPSAEAVINQSDAAAIITAWPEFKTLKDKKIIDCRYML